MPVTHPIQPRVLTRTHQITGSLQLTRGHMDRLEQASREQPGELARAQERMLQVQLIKATHEPQIRFAHPARLVVHRRARQPQ